MNNTQVIRFGRGGVGGGANDGSINQGSFNAIYN